MDEIAGLDATAQAELVRSGEVSPTELVDGAIARIEQLNPQLNAVIWPLFERARAEAAGPLPDGPFRGVPFLLKDFAAELEGTPFTEGSDLSGDYISGESQELTLRFQRAGFVICGKTNTPELGILPVTEPRRFGPTNNPWDVTRTTGGSSGGSAAAVASGMVPVAHANDGGGSIRIPASCCGLFGLKPSRGRVTLAPRYGDVMGGLVAEHVVSRSVRDSAAILDCTSAPAPGDPYWAPPPARPFAAEVGADPGRMRVGVTTTSPTNAPVQPACTRAVERAAELCADLGHEVVEVTLPNLDESAFTEHFITMWACGIAWAVLDWEQRIGRVATEDDLEPLSWSLISLGRSTSADRYLKAIQEMQRVTRQLAAWAADLDVLVTPTLGEPPLPRGTLDSPADNPLHGLFRAATFVPFTPMCNVTGQPAASIPLHWDDDGLPIGVQVIARYGDEASIIRLASQLEAAAPWADRRPPVFATG